MAGSRTTPKCEMPAGKDGVDQALDQLFSYGTNIAGPAGVSKGARRHWRERIGGRGFFVAGAAGTIRARRAIAGRQRTFARAAGGGFQDHPAATGRRRRRRIAKPRPPGRPRAAGRAVPQERPGPARNHARDHQGAHHSGRARIITGTSSGPTSRPSWSSAKSRRKRPWRSSKNISAPGRPPDPSPTRCSRRRPPNAPCTTQVPDSSRVQDKVTLAETLGLTRTNADYYALQLGNHVLGGGFYATRLYRDLREKSGLVYFVGSSFNIGLTRGVYQVEYACDPPNVAKARAMILSNLRRHADQERDRAGIAPGQADAAARHSAVGIQRGSHRRRLAVALLLGLPLDEPMRAAQRYVKLTAARCPRRLRQMAAARTTWCR